MQPAINPDSDNRGAREAQRLGRSRLSVPQRLSFSLETQMERDEDGVVLGSTGLPGSQRLHRKGDATREAGSLVGPMTAADSPSAISVFRIKPISPRTHLQTHHQSCPPTHQTPIPPTKSANPVSRLGAFLDMVEARGVEPLSEQPSTAASTCLAVHLISAEGFDRQNPLYLDPC